MSHFPLLPECSASRLALGVLVNLSGEALCPTFSKQFPQKNSDETHVVVVRVAHSVARARRAERHVVRAAVADVARARRRVRELVERRPAAHVAARDARPAAEVRGRDLVEEDAAVVDLCH